MVVVTDARKTRTEVGFGGAKQRGSFSCGGAIDKIRGIWDLRRLQLN